MYELALAKILTLLRAYTSNGLAYRSANLITSTEANTAIRVRVIAPALQYTILKVVWLAFVRIDSGKELKPTKSSPF